MTFKLLFQCITMVIVLGISLMMFNNIFLSIFIMGVYSFLFAVITK